MGVREDTPVGGAELARLFRRAFRLMVRAGHRGDLARHAQARVLAILRERGPVSQRELLEELDVRSSSLSEVLGKLEQGGWIRRERNPEDRRGFVVSATERGLNAAGSGDAESLFACLDDEERRRLRDILAKLADGLCDEEAEDAGGFGGPHGRGRGNCGRGRGCGGPRGRGRRRG